MPRPGKSGRNINPVKVYLLQFGYGDSLLKRFQAFIIVSIVLALQQHLFLYTIRRVSSFYGTKKVFFSKVWSHTRRTGECIHYVELGWAFD
jgi:hypothetical protein